MEAWKNTIKLGNQHFANNELASALAVYKTAQVFAEDLFYHWSNAEEAVSAVVVTYLNIADLYNKQGAVCSATTTLQKIHRMLLRELASTESDSQRHTALYRGSMKTHTALMAHKRCHLSPTLH